MGKTEIGAAPKGESMHSSIDARGLGAPRLSGAPSDTARARAGAPPIVADLAAGSGRASDRGFAAERVGEAVEEIDRLIAALRRVTRASQLDLSLAVGALVVDTLYRGDLRALRSHGRKELSLRRLCQHPGLPFSPSTLWRHLAVYELLERMPAPRAASHLRIPHFRAVTGLAPDAQDRLLTASEREAWSVETLARRAAQHRQEQSPQRGRRAQSPAVRALRKVEKILSVEGLESLPELDHLDAAERAALDRAVRQMRAWCDHLAPGLFGSVSRS